MFCVKINILLSAFQFHWIYNSVSDKYLFLLNLLEFIVKKKIIKFKMMILSFGSENIDVQLSQRVLNKFYMLSLTIHMRAVIFSI